MKYFLKFLTVPTETPKKGNFKVWISITLLNIIYTIVCYVFIYLLFSSCGVYIPKIETDFSQYPFLAILLIAPVFEEILFRLHLVRSKKNIYISIIAIVFGLISKIGFETHFYSTYFLPIRIVIAVLLGLIIGKLVAKYIPKINYTVYFYLFAFAFGIVHIINYNLAAINSLGSLLYVITYALVKVPNGMMFGYIRLRNGFIPAACSHFLLNAPVIISIYWSLTI